jgi:hypothetical protein
LILAFFVLPMAFDYWSQRPGASPAPVSIDEVTGPDAHRRLADGSTPASEASVVLNADGGVVIGAARHSIDRAGEVILASFRGPVELVVIVVAAEVPPSLIAQLVRALTESGAARQVTLKRAA